ncbi:Xaa-Pro dipeptidyl-peptidase [Xylocopilactobacillus apicola]|uniref:Xaa-Pro dipeptidyl-peptidase n=1 Tax=Xylocopilactobacillus apicola TaxID=2932184 RepID=A0AAU9DRP4_9LACO|nr:Xaa-Pro dipeptidyl-peptidase [Xylocopilactobacillus apicola]BDR58639.1 Xaa-Pro dipeptidyl-peptidase [Xylocopilactobacillus apicola]
MTTYHAFSKYDQFDPEKELRKINFLSETGNFADRFSFYFEKLVSSEDQLNFIAADKNQSLAELISQKPKCLSSEVFYTLVLQIMDFNLGLEFQINHAIDFLKTSEQNILSESIVDESNIEKFIFNTLNLRSANGLSLIDNLANDGFLKNINSPLFFAGKTLPVFDQYVRENYYLDTRIDTDQDGFSDQVLVEVTRPKTNNKVPVILCADPYYKGTNEMSEHLNSIEGDLFVKEPGVFKDLGMTDYPEAPTKNMINSLDQPTKRSANQATKDFPLNDYFLARGFAVAYVAGLGTRGSDGMRTTGDAAETITYCHAVKFLSGNEAGSKTRDGAKKIILPWTNGSVAMTGRSYLGTLATATATKNPNGLKTIISESAISNWYDYYRENGLVVAPGGYPGEDADVLALDTYSRWFDGMQYLKTHQLFQNFMDELKNEQDRQTGNYNQFWRDRNYLPEADQIQVDCLYAHGLNDWNVKPINVYNIFHQAKNAKVKVILHQGQHISPHDLASIDYLDLCNLWLTDHLYEKENHVVDMLPPVMVQNNRNPGHWSGLSDWGSKHQKSIKLGSNLFSYTDDLTRIYREKFNQNLTDYESAFALKDEIFKDRCFYKDLNLKEDLVIDGQINLKVKMSTDHETGILSAALYEINASKISTTVTNPVPNRFFQLIPGQERMPLKDFQQKNAAYRLISFGHLNLQNIEGPDRVNQVIANQEIDLTLALQPTIYQLDKNSTLRLVLFGSDMKYTTHVLTPQIYQLDLPNSQIEIPYK